MNKPRIRIAQEVTGSTGNFVTGMWDTTGFFVRNRATDECVEVKSPEEAKDVAFKMAAQAGGRVYRGQLPNAWHATLSQIKRSTS
jgi:hypothetical protein